jgi:hypothetical protein
VPFELTVPFFAWHASRSDMLLISKQSGIKFKFVSVHMLDTLMLGLPMTTSSKAYARQFTIQTGDGGTLEVGASLCVCVCVCVCVSCM